MIPAGQAPIAPRPGPIWKGRGRDNECFLCGRVMLAPGLMGCAHLGDDQWRHVGPDCKANLVAAGEAGVMQTNGVVMWASGYGPGKWGRIMRGHKAAQGGIEVMSTPAHTPPPAPAQWQLPTDNFDVACRKNADGTTDWLDADSAIAMSNAAPAMKEALERVKYLDRNDPDYDEKIAGCRSALAAATGGK